MDFFGWLPGAKKKQVIAQLRSPDLSTRRRALDALPVSLTGEKQRPVREAVIAALRDQDPDVRRAALNLFRPDRTLLLLHIHEVREAASEGDQAQTSLKAAYLTSVDVATREFGIAQARGRFEITSPMSPSELRGAVERLLERVGLIDILDTLVHVATRDPDPEIASSAAAMLRGSMHHNLLTSMSTDVEEYLRRQRRLTSMSKGSQHPAPLTDGRGKGKVSALVEELTDLVTRKDILRPEEVFGKIAIRFSDASRAGSEALADLIDDLYESRSKGLLWALVVAGRVRGREAKASPRLRDSLERITSFTAEPIRHGGEGRFVPETFGDGKVGFTDATWKQVKQLAHKAHRRLFTG